MDNKEQEFNLEENVSRRKKFTILGLILIIIGVASVITAFVDFFISVSSIGNRDGGAPKLFFLFFIGIPFVFAGLVLLLTFNQGRLARLAASQTAQVNKDVTNYMLDGTKEQIGAVAGEIAKNITQSKQNTNGLDDIKKLKELLDMGAITPEEYEREKKEILDKN